MPMGDCNRACRVLDHMPTSNQPVIPTASKQASTRVNGADRPAGVPDQASVYFDIFGKYFQFFVLQRL